MCPIIVFALIYLLNIAVRAPLVCWWRMPYWTYWTSAGQRQKRRRLPRNIPTWRFWSWGALLLWGRIDLYYHSQMSRRFYPFQSKGNVRRARNAALHKSWVTKWSLLQDWRELWQPPGLDIYPWTRFVIFHDYDVARIIWRFSFFLLSFYTSIYINR